MLSTTPDRPVICSLQRLPCLVPLVYDVLVGRSMEEWIIPVPRFYLYLQLISVCLPFHIYCHTRFAAYALMSRTEKAEHCSFFFCYLVGSVN